MTFTPLHFMHKMKRGSQPAAVISLQRRTVHLGFYWAYKLPGCLFFFFLLNFLFCIGVEPINNFVTVSGEQLRDSAIHMHVSILPQTLLPSRLPHNIEQSSLCYLVGLCWLSILNPLICLTNNHIFILFIFLGLPTHSYVSLSFS